MLTLVGLTSLLLIAGVAVGARLYPESRSERALAACLVALTLALLPIQALGWLTMLTRGSLIASALGLSSVVMGGALAGPGWRARVKTLGTELRAFVMLPVDAIREAARARSFVTLVLVVTLLVIAWATWLAWLAPSGGWDGLWYHEPMVGFAIQNRGFALVDLPTQHAWINGYPRTSEHLMLWVTLLGDRRLIDAVPSAMALLAILGAYCLMRPHGSERVLRAGLACVLVTIPGAVLQLRSTYVDLTVLAAFLPTLHFVTRPGFSSRDAWMGAMGLAFLGGTKSTGLFYVAMLGGVGLAAFVLHCVRTKRATPILHALAALPLVALMVAPSYWRNWAIHHNPIWPLRYESALLGQTFEGPHDISDMQLPFGQVMHEFFAIPVAGQDYHDTRKHAFGYGLTFVGIPLLIVALGALVVRAWSSLFAKGREHAHDARLLLVFLLGLATLVTSPAYYWARYALPMPAASLAVIYAYFAERGRRRFLEGAIGAMAVLNFVTLTWASPGWDVPLETAWTLMGQTSEERVGAEVSHNLLPPEVARRREEVIGPGDVVVFDSQVSFLGTLWNESMTNHVVWVSAESSAEEYLARLDDLNAEWALVRRGGREERALRSSDAWIALANGSRDDMVYERAPSAPEEQEPSAPEEQEPSAPAGQEPSAPAGQEPSAPAGQEPSAPAGQEPSTPAEQERALED